MPDLIHAFLIGVAAVLGMFATATAMLAFMRSGSKTDREFNREHCERVEQRLTLSMQAHQQIAENLAMLLEGTRPGFRLEDHLERQRRFSETTFGPGTRAKGVVAHIRKELDEIEAAPADLEEWIDVVILAFDGAWRTGATPEGIVAALEAKQAKNESRSWPDWRTADPEGAIEHDRSAEVPA